MTDPVYDSCSALMEALVAGGVREVVISPGSRSTPLTVTAHHHPGLTSWIQIDERSAAFFALGLARLARRPVALICTSGTAAANYLPAVVEANHAAIPLVVITADRPAELRGWGAGQTIDQTALYGTNTRWFAELPVAGEVTPDRYGRYGHRAVETVRVRPGPVHLNCPLREPLDPAGWTVPTGDVASGDAVAVSFRPAPRTASSDEVRRLVTLAEGHERGVIALGPIDDPGLADAVTRVSRLAGWPILAEPTSQLRAGPHTTSASVIGTVDHLLKIPTFAEATVPDVVIRLGMAPTCKPLRLWLEKHRPPHVVLVDPWEQWNEPSFTVSEIVRADPRELLERVAAELEASHPRTTRWSTRWRRADDVARSTIDDQLSAGELCEPGVVAAMVAALPDDAVLVVSNSMPVRDLDAFMAVSSRPLRVHSHRGASGIDGLVSAAGGAAAADVGPVVLFTGDLALLHDTSGLLAARRLGLSLTIVVVNNDGGAIFSFLPIAAHGDAVSFDELFRTPHGHDLADVAALAGSHTRATSTEQLTAALERSVGADGVAVIEVPVDRDLDLAQHRAVTVAVGDALVAAGLAGESP